MESKKELVDLDDIKIEITDLERVEEEYERFLESIESVKGDIETLVGEENRYLLEANEKLRREIEERIKIELKLNDQLLFLEALMDSIPNPIVYYADNDGYLGSNRAFLTFVGRKESEVRGVPREALVRVEKGPDAAGRILCEGKCVVEECRVKDQAGRLREMMIYSSGYESSSDTGGRVEVLIDITEQKAADRRHRAQEQLLIQQSKMAAMGEMIGHIADQWRRPLGTLESVIDGVMTTYRDGNLDKAYIKDAIGNGTEIARGMAQTIDEFGSFFRPDKRKNRFRIKDVIDITLELLSATLERRHIVVEVTGDERVAMEGYRNELSQVLLNILHNAADVLIEREVRSPKITITYGKKGARIFIGVADNGGGVPEALMERIFELYFSTKKESMGSGIGLYMARTIVEQHLSGSLLVQNEAEGAHFRIEIPV